MSSMRRRHNSCFPEQEIRDARREMEGLGVDTSKPYVALIVRDEKYFGKMGRKLSDWRMRNRPISDFAPGAAVLTQRGCRSFDWDT